MPISLLLEVVASNPSIHLGNVLSTLAPSTPTNLVNEALAASRIIWTLPKFSNDTMIASADFSNSSESIGAGGLAPDFVPGAHSENPLARVAIALISW
jgi:hypothetical protein